MTDDYLAFYARMREWKKADVGKLFSTYENLTALAWQADSRDSISDKSLREAWEKQRAARTAFLKAIGAPVEEPKT